MSRKALYHSTDSIRINRDNYRHSLNLSRFARYLLCVLLKGESPIENRSVYRGRPLRF